MFNVLFCVEIRERVIGFINVVLGDNHCTLEPPTTESKRETQRVGESAFSLSVVTVNKG